MYLAIFVFWLYCLTWEITGYLPWSNVVPHFVFASVLWGLVVLPFLVSSRLDVFFASVANEPGKCIVHLMLLFGVSTVFEMVILGSGIHPNPIHLPLNIVLAGFVLLVIHIAGTSRGKSLPNDMP